MDFVIILMTILAFLWDRRIKRKELLILKHEVEQLKLQNELLMAEN